MERFVCVNGSDNLQIPSHILQELELTSAEQFHRNPGMIASIAERMESSGWVRLPFCNTLCCEALGAAPTLSMAGARVKEPPYRQISDLPETFSADTARLSAMMQALETLAARGKAVAYNMEGPFSLLCTLLPMNRVFAALRKPEGAAMLARAEDWAIAYADLAVSRGAKLLSFADPIATRDILGDRVFLNVYVPCLKRVLARLQEKHPHIPVHLCGKLTQSLLDTESCTVEIWNSEGCDTYGQALTRFCCEDTGGLVGHFCLNFLDAKRPYIKLIYFKEERSLT